MKKIEEWLIILYFFICPCELVLNIAITSSTKYIGILILIVWIIKTVRNPETTFNLSGKISPLVIWLAICVISLAWGNTSELTLDYLTNYLEMGLLVILLVQEEWPEKSIGRFFLAYCLGSICLSIATLSLGEVRYLGRSTIVFMGRAIDPNQLPANIIPGAIISLGYTINNKIKIQYRALSALAFLLTVYTVFLTGSRGALLGIGGGMLFTYFFQSNGISFNRIIYIILSMILIWFALHLLPKETTDRILGFDTYTDTYANGENRITIWKSLLDDFDAQWMIGHGVGSTIAYFRMLVGKLRSVHNTYLLVMYEVGFVGFAFFIYPYVSMIYYCVKSKKNVASGVLFASLITSFFLDSLNLRYLWNGLVVCIMLYNCSNNTELPRSQFHSCKYLRGSAGTKPPKRFSYIR